MEQRILIDLRLFW